MSQHSIKIQNFVKHYNWKGSPEELIIKLIRELIDKFPSSVQLSIEQRLIYAASCQGIMSTSYEKMSETESAKLIPNGNRFNMIINSTHSEGRQLFSRGHETTHTFFSVISDDTEHDYSGSSLCQDPFEEKLCDIGASEFMFYKLDLNDKPFNILTLKYIVEKTKASNEAAAFYMVRSNRWGNTGLICWKRKLKPSQNKDQLGILPEYSSQEEFRVEYSQFQNGLYLPKEKSVDIGDAIDKAYASNDFIAGDIILKLSPAVQFQIESIRLYENTVLSLVGNITYLENKRTKTRFQEPTTSLFS